MIVTRQIEWDMGHRVTNHRSKCRNLHGHRYKMIVHVSGKLIDKSGDSSEGMVIDFQDIKKIIVENIHDVLDHGFMVWQKDHILMDFFKKQPGFKYISVPFVPTAENIARWSFERLKPLFIDKFGTNLKLVEIQLWETPNSLVICCKKDIV